MPTPEQRASRGAGVGPAACAALRLAWDCDCGGSRPRGTPLAGPTATVRRHLDVIESVTGHRPPTCPWRAFYDPLVDYTARRLVVSSEKGYAMARLGVDPPELLVDALDAFHVARAAGERHVRRFLERKNKPSGCERAAGRRSAFVSMRRGRRG